MRRAILAANWKLHKRRAEAEGFVRDFRGLCQAAAWPTAEIVIAPAFTALAAVEAAIGDARIALAAQDVSTEPEGTFTGEVSASMLGDAGCSYCIIGHSERRTLYGETSAEVARKARALQDAGIAPILCVGEQLAEREADQTQAIVGAQLEDSLNGTDPAHAAALVVAYEPIWAIGTGVTATPELAQEVHAFIRGRLRDRFGEQADAIRIQYGGSVKPDNVAAIMAQPDIDGALVGGASLEPHSFYRIVAHDREENLPS
jgi:triosephosphate isomerase